MLVQHTGDNCSAYIFAIPLPPAEWHGHNWGQNQPMDSASCPPYPKPLWAQSSSKQSYSYKWGLRLARREGEGRDVGSEVAHHPLACYRKFLQKAQQIKVAQSCPMQIPVAVGSPEVGLSRSERKKVSSSTLEIRGSEDAEGLPVWLFYHKANLPLHV